MIERFNRTIRSKIDTYMLENNTKKYIDVIQKLVDNYNNTVHRTTNKKPNDINEDGENEIYNETAKKHNIV